MAYLNYNHFYYFWVVAKAGSIKAACDRLHLSQPTISDQLRQFEESIGTPLFDRRVRKLILNSDGKRALQFANRIFTDGENFFHSFQKGSIKRRTVLNVGIDSSISRSLCYQLLFSIIKDGTYFPKVREGSFRYLRHELELGNIDLALLDSLIHGPEITSLKILERRFVAVCSSKFRESNIKSGRFPKNIEGCDFINHSEDSALAKIIQGYFRSNKVSPRTIALIQDVNLILESTLNSLCFSILPEVVASKLLKEKSLHLLGRIDGLHSEIYACFHRSKDHERIHTLISKIQV